MNNEQLLHSIEDSHTVSVDEALMLMLGIRGELRHYVDGEVIDVFLADILFDIQERADIDLANTKVYKVEYRASGGDDESRLSAFAKMIQEYQVALDNANAQVERYNDYSLKLKHEVAKARSGQQSILVVDPDETQRMGFTQITTISLFEWCKSELKLDLLSPTRSINNLAPVKPSVTLTKNNSITTYLLAFLLGRLIDTAREKELLNDGEYKVDGSLKRIVDGDKVTAAALYRYWEKELRDYENQKGSALVRRISNAQKQTTETDIQALTEEEFSTSIDDGAENFRNYHGGNSLPGDS